MNFLNTKKLLLSGFAALSLVSLSACDAVSSVAGGELSASADDPVLAEPAVGDLWSAELSEFSDQTFGDGSEEYTDAYGLMKVIEVSDDAVVVITEMGAWPNGPSSVLELNGDLAAITWDESEEITVNRADIPGLIEKGHILASRRLEE